MKITFELSDEKTITNKTVKVSALISGVINNQDRAALETQAKELTKKLFDKNWSFSNFTYLPDGFTFSVTATTRIDSADNDRLSARAAELSTRGKLMMEIIEADTSIPLHDRRAAESDLRISLIEKAKAEAEKLGGTVETIAFSQARSQALSNVRMASASYMALESVSNDAPGGGASLGHSEKILMNATLHVVTGGKEATQLNG